MYPRFPALGPLKRAQPPIRPPLNRTYRRFGGLVVPTQNNSCTAAFHAAACFCRPQRQSHSSCGPRAGTSAPCRPTPPPPAGNIKEPSLNLHQHWGVPTPPSGVTSGKVPNPPWPSSPGAWPWAIGRSFFWSGGDVGDRPTELMWAGCYKSDIDLTAGRA